MIILTDFDVNDLTLSLNTFSLLKVTLDVC